MPHSRRRSPGVASGTLHPLVTLPNLIQPPSSRGYSTGDETEALCDPIKVALVPISRLASFHAFLSRRAASGSYNDRCLSTVLPRTEEG